MRPYFVILAPSISRNSLGRALFLADMLTLIGFVEIAAYRDGRIWAGARDFQWKVKGLNSFSEFVHLLGSVEESTRKSGERAVVVTVKPFKRSLGWAAAIKRRYGHDRWTLVADVDDLDAELSRDFINKSLVNRARLSPLKSEHPARIEKLLKNDLPLADVLTVSTWALRERLPALSVPHARLPHPRPAVPYLPPTSRTEGRCRLGFLGTPRSHKGIDKLVEFLSLAPFLELHLLEGTVLPAVPSQISERVVYHPHAGRDTVRKAYEHIDLVVLPQARTSEGSEYQLPAKLLDAMRFGRPVIAPPTRAIREIATGAAILVDFDRPSALIVEDLKAWSNDRPRLDSMGRTANRIFSECFSAEVLAPQFAGILKGLEVDRRKNAPVPEEK